jgi:hypothetical protein
MTIFSKKVVAKYYVDDENEEIREVGDFMIEVDGDQEYVNIVFGKNLLSIPTKELKGLEKVIEKSE